MKRRKVARIENFILTVVANSTNNEFRANFRVTRGQSELLLTLALHTGVYSTPHKKFSSLMKTIREMGKFFIIVNLVDSLQNTFP